MKPWQPAWLTPFQSLQLIVYRRHDEQTALSFPDFSLLTRHAAIYSDRVALKAFYDAERDLITWCREGNIDGYGFTTEPRTGHEIRERLTTYWVSDRTFDFGIGGLRGRPYIARVTLSRDDILIKLDTGVVEIALSEKAPTALPNHRGRKPIYDWPAAEEAFLRRVDSDGWPEDLTNEVGWQSQSDVERWVASILNNKPSESVIRKNVKVWLNRHRPIRPAI